MAISYESLLGQLSAASRRRIRQRAKELLAEESTLQELRKARSRSQRAVARKLHVKQAAVSKLERRTDMYVSTLRSYVEAVGGELEIIARFPDAKPVRIRQFEELR